MPICSLSWSLFLYTELLNCDMLIFIIHFILVLEIAVFSLVLFVNLQVQPRINFLDVVLLSMNWLNDHAHDSSKHSANNRDKNMNPILIGLLTIIWHVPSIN